MTQNWLVFLNLCMKHAVLLFGSRSRPWLWWCLDNAFPVTLLVPPGALIAKVITLELIRHPPTSDYIEPLLDALFHSLGQELIRKASKYHENLWNNLETPLKPSITHEKHEITLETIETVQKPWDYLEELWQPTQSHEWLRKHYFGNSRWITG